MTGLWRAGRFLSLKRVESRGFILLDTFVRADPLRSPEIGEVFKFGIAAANQGELLLLPPAFELFLAIDGVANVGELLEMKEAVAGICLRETFEGTVLVLHHANK